MLVKHNSEIKKSIVITGIYLGLHIWGLSFISTLYWFYVHEIKLLRNLNFGLEIFRILIYSKV